MKTILQMILARWRPVIQYAGANGKQHCYHVTLPKAASEEDIYAAREGCASLGYTTLVYHTEHSGLPHFGVFSDC